MLQNITTKEQNEIDDILFEKSRRENLSLTTCEYVQNFAIWHSMITLTMDNEHLCGREGFLKRIKYLIRLLNRDLYGDNYTRVIGHCYFSYVLGFELTTNKVLHAHMLVDRPIDFSKLHKIWNFVSGFAFIRRVDDNEKASRYISKYVTKDGDLIFYKPKLYRPPFTYPLWWSLKWH